MLVAAFKEVAVVAKRESNRAWASCDLYDQIKIELYQVRVVHNEEVISLWTIIDGIYQQLEET